MGRAQSSAGCGPTGHSQTWHVRPEKGADTPLAGGLDFERRSGPMDSRAFKFRRRFNLQEDEEGSQRGRLIVREGRLHGRSSQAGGRSESDRVHECALGL